MTRNWTDHPISSAIKRKEIHITEIQEAYSERAVFLESSAGTASQITAPNPTVWYRHIASPLMEEEWNNDNPLADPIHWPPNEVPDNEFRNEHIYDLRTLLTYDSDYSGLAHPIIYTASSSIQDAFSVPDQAWYHSYGTTGEDLFDDAIGLPTYSDKTSLTAGSVKPHKNHINQLRAICEQLREVRLVFHNSVAQRKEGYGESAVSYAAAWSAAKAAFASASWGTGVFQYATRITSALGLETVASYGSPDYLYKASVSAQRATYTFDLDVSLSTEWAKVLIWNVLSGLGGLWEDVGVMAGISIAGGGYVNVDLSDGNDYDKLYVDDVTMGSSSVEIIISGKDDFSSATLDLLSPTLSLPEVWTRRRSEGFQNWQTATLDSTTILVNCLPEWSHGAP